MSSSDLSPDERLRIQNELTKSDLSDRHGAHIGFIPGAPKELTPEQEKAFLENISRLEDGGRESYVTIRSLVSKKAIKVAAAKAKQRKWEDACDELLKAFISAGVATKMPEWITFQGWYYFLSSDFLDHTIPPPPPVEEGATQRHMVGAYYDHVRKDSPDMMFQITNNLLLDMLNVEEPFTSASLLAHKVRNGQEIQTRAEAVAKIEAWRNQWVKIEPGSFEQKGIIRGPDGAPYFTFDCAFTAYAKTGSYTEFESDGAVQFITVDKHLEVVGLMMPGFELWGIELPSNLQLCGRKN